MRGLVDFAEHGTKRKAILARDGRLFVSVALAWSRFPTRSTGLINPKGMADASGAGVDRRRVADLPRWSRWPASSR